MFGASITYIFIDYTHSLTFSIRFKLLVIFLNIVLYLCVLFNICTEKKIVSDFLEKEELIARYNKQKKRPINEASQFLAYGLIIFSAATISYGVLVNNKPALGLPLFYGISQTSYCVSTKQNHFFPKR